MKECAGNWQTTTSTNLHHHFRRHYMPPSVFDCVSLLTVPLTGYCTISPPFPFLTAVICCFQKKAVNCFSVTTNGQKLTYVVKESPLQEYCLLQSLTVQYWQHSTKHQKSKTEKEKDVSLTYSKQFIKLLCTLSKPHNKLI